jgi:hypothetical protein
MNIPSFIKRSAPGHYATSSMLPLAADLKIASSAAMFHTICSCGIG